MSACYASGMRQLLAVVVALATLAACGSCAATGFPARATPAEVVRGEDARTVLLDGLTPEGARYMCSGVLVSDHQVVTANHCAPDGALILGTRPDGSVAFFVPEVVLPGLDLVRLATIPGVFGPAPVRPLLGPSASLDERLCISAAVPRRDHKCGFVQFTEGSDGMFYFDAVVEHGNSGGGVYDDAGRLVGIVDILYNASNGQVMGTGARAIGAALAWLVRP